MKMPGSYGFNLASFLLLSAILLSTMRTCQRFEPEGFLYVENLELIEALENEVRISAEVEAEGEVNASERGFCWSISEEPTLSDNVVKEGQGEGKFTATITGLYPSTSYILRAYATNSSGTTYSNSIRISTLEERHPPELITSEVSEITTSTARSGGTVTKEGSSRVIAKGVCWSTSENPDTDDYKTVDGEGTGSFSSMMNNLESETRYYVRAYAINETHTAYGNPYIFVTDSEPVSIPNLKTSIPVEITTGSAQSGGEIISDGGAALTAKGICWSTSPSPTVEDFVSDEGTENGSFTSEISDLTKSTTYYIRAYATNSAGTAYGNEVILRTYEGTVTDIDGNSYWTVMIGDQQWMAENLKVTHYTDSISIPYVDSWGNVGILDKAYCWYDNRTANRNAFGGLYSWGAAMNGASSSSSNPSGVQGVCPEGWHLPSDREWTELVDFLGGGTTAGGKLKEAGSSHWESPNTGGSNSSGFTAIPGGFGNIDGWFYSVGQLTAYWTATEYSGSNAWFRSLYFDNEGLGRFDGYKDFAYSVRCVSD